MSAARQRGIALTVVLAIVLLCSMLALGALRSALLGEMATGHDSDYQRALATAEALLRDAESDIKGERADGSACRPDSCRSGGILDIRAGRVFFPTSVSQWLDLQAALGTATPSCAAGICVPDRVREQFWLDRAALDAMKKVGAAPGAYTGARAAGATHQAWYWVELLPYDMAAASAGGLAEALAPDRTTPFVYRITALAQGHRPGTQAVVQTTLVWKKVRS
jgi:type IV pilus assembly protein PilX